MNKKIFGLTLVAVLTLGAATASAQATKFNLTCTGTQRTLMPSILMDEAKPYSTAYRIDLDAMKWCADACEATSNVAEATPTAITLEAKSVDTPREHEVYRNVISRVTGAHNSSIDSGVGSRRMSMFWNGQCERAEFSGFPTPAVKF